MGDSQVWSARHFLALLAGQEPLLDKVRAGGTFVLQTPFAYPGRGPLELRLESGDGRVRLSEGGDLLKFLESQGMDPAVDTIISKTVWHAAREVEGSLGSGQVWVETVPDEVPVALARFTQVLLEVVGLRHSKYKDALVKLERGSNFDDPLAPTLR